MDKKVISCAFNIDTACVEVRFVDGSMISVDCTLVEADLDTGSIDIELTRNNLIHVVLPKAKIIRTLLLLR